MRRPGSPLSSMAAAQQWEPSSPTSPLAQSRRDEARQVTGRLMEAGQRIMELNSTIPDMEDDRDARWRQQLREEQEEQMETVAAIGNSRAMSSLSAAPPVLTGTTATKAQQLASHYGYMRNTEPVEALMSEFFNAANDSAIAKALALMSGAVVAIYEGICELVAGLDFAERAKAMTTCVPASMRQLRDIQCLVDACEQSGRAMADKVERLEGQVRKQAEEIERYKECIKQLETRQMARVASARPSLESIHEVARVWQPMFCVLVQVQDAPLLGRVCPDEYSAALGALEDCVEDLAATFQGRRSNCETGGFTATAGHCVVFMDPEDAVWFACQLQERALELPYKDGLLEYTSCRMVLKETAARNRHPPPVAVSGWSSSGASSPIERSPMNRPRPQTVGGGSCKLPSALAAPQAQGGLPHDTVFFDNDDVLWRGLRVRCAIHQGSLEPDALSDNGSPPYYTGATLKRCAAMLDAARGGEVLVSSRAWQSYAMKRNGMNMWGQQQHEFDYRMVHEAVDKLPRPLRRGEVDRVYFRGLEERTPEFDLSVGSQLNFESVEFYTRRYQAQGSDPGDAVDDAESFDDSDDGSREDMPWHVDFLMRVKLRQHVGVLHAEVHSVRTVLEAQERWFMRQHDVYQGEEASDLCRGEVLPPHPEHIAAAVSKVLRVEQPEQLTTAELDAAEGHGRGGGPGRMTVPALHRALRGIFNINRGDDKVDRRDPMYHLLRANVVLAEVYTTVDTTPPSAALQTAIKPLTATITKRQRPPVKLTGDDPWADLMLAGKGKYPSELPQAYYLSISAYAVKILETLGKRADAMRALPAVKTAKRASKVMKLGPTPMNTELNPFGIEARQRALKESWRKRRGGSICGDGEPDTPSTLASQGGPSSPMASLPSPNKDGGPPGGRVTPGGLRRGGSLRQPTFA